MGETWNPFDTSRDHLAGVFNEGMMISGEMKTGPNLAMALLSQGQLGVTGGQLQGGMAAMNELITRTGMGIGDAAGIVQQFGAVGATGMEGNMTGMRALGMLGHQDLLHLLLPLESPKATHLMRSSKLLGPHPALSGPPLSPGL